MKRHSEDKLNKIVEKIKESDRPKKKVGYDFNGGFYVECCTDYEQGYNDCLEAHKKWILQELAKLLYTCEPIPTTYEIVSAIYEKRIKELIQRIKDDK